MQLWVIRATFGVEKFDFNTKFVGKSKSLSEVVPKVLVVSKRLGQDLCCIRCLLVVLAIHVVQPRRVSTDSPISPGVVKKILKKVSQWRC